MTKELYTRILEARKDFLKVYIVAHPESPAVKTILKNKAAKEVKKNNF